MQTLYHYPICPLSRQARIYLKEFDQNFNITQENYWIMNSESRKNNKFATLPAIYIKSENYTIMGIYSILEYMFETQEKNYFMPNTPIERAKVRQYIHWFNDKFYRQVTKILIDEKITNLLKKQRGPRSKFIMIAKYNLTQHFKFLTSLLEENSYIISEAISCADITAAAHISSVDYLGEINWDSWNLIKEWYSIIKSRPSFQQLLKDRIPGFLPSSKYSKLDF